MSLQENLFPTDTSLTFEQVTTTNGIKAKLLLDHPIFREVVAALYADLVNQEDALDPDAPHTLTENLRLQRRLLRQVIGNLEYRVASHLQLEQELKEKAKLQEEPFSFGGT